MNGFDHEEEKKGKRGSMKKANITLCNLPPLSLNEPFFPFFSIHPSVLSGFVYHWKKKGNRKYKQMGLDKGAGHGRQDTGPQAEKNQRDGAMTIVRRSIAIFSLHASRKALLLFICAHSSNLSDQQTDSSGKVHRTMDNGQKGRHCYGKAQQTITTHGFGTAKDLRRKRTSFSLTSLFSLSGFSVKSRLLEHISQRRIRDIRRHWHNAFHLLDRQALFAQQQKRQMDDKAARQT